MCDILVILVDFDRQSCFILSRGVYSSFCPPPGGLEGQIYDILVGWGKI